MGPYQIGNLNNPPLNNVNGKLVNAYGFHTGSFSFSNTFIPSGYHTMPPAGSNIQGAASIYPCTLDVSTFKNKKRIFH